MTRALRTALVAVAVVALLAVAAAVAVTAIDRSGSGPSAADATVVAPVPFDHLPVVVERAAGEAGGCPAHAYRAPAEPMLNAQADAEGSGGGSGTYAVGDGSHLIVHCLGPTSEHPALETWGDEVATDDGGFPSRDVSFEERPGLGLVARQTLGLDDGEVVVTDWVFEKDGWMFVVGHLKAPGGHGPAEALLSSWTWG